MKTILFFFLGASLASFIGLVVDRFPNQSIVRPASHCQNCQQRLSVRDLIPVFSQIINGSKCRLCGQGFPTWYGIFEALTGLIFTLAAWQVLTWEQVFLLLFSSCLSLYDLKHQEFPLLIWLIPSLACLIFRPLNPLCLILLLLAILAELIDLKIGSGDFAYLATLALFCDLNNLIWIVELAALAGILVCLVSKQKRIPFLPYLSLAYLVILIIEKIS